MMTNKPFAALGLAFLVGVSACNNDSLTSVNKNPNAPEQVSSDLLFASAAVRTVDEIRNTIEVTPSTFVHWPQYLAEYQYPQISYYEFRTTTADAWWNAFYSGPLEDLHQALKQSTAAQRPNQIGPILVMRAVNYTVMTGMWGDIPFSEANRGDEGKIIPKYDTQQVIYDSLLKNLSDVNTMMSDAAGVGFGSQDPVYSGDVAHWKKLANSLRARLGLNLSKVNATRA